ncbi:hypothetical protein AJ78_04096 [Emergomyces pasteurianus Ep9510]|uniref:Uncharacterized protein n=1 Tax=Emergomyces pasteurianus Ep9510 TaxID=1447872 RepID=A0A1J9PI48_9EURO|nr:hypothetical protein AJ78_04096 [Emergomyces pasteurianus Ep9510]
MRMTWDPRTDAKLLRGILKYTKLGKKGHEELAAYMGCTVIAIQKRLQKLLATTPRDAPAASPPSTPVQKEKSPGGKASSAANRILTNGPPDLSTPRKRKVLAEWTEEGDDSTCGSPTKRLKPGKAGKIKLENRDVTEDDYA